ncbi:hypothetical protein [Paenibacillus montanisoli]|uniref:Uncharacterized protein n=1 Tax=Paenibacillus montanisoli TaxID=2081970 RepID=A0A328TV22_9BACL|nr:hypothetical protein [Paenibacillus montanisoli]RAP73442.1 hypothetical protein DL346_27470 [Paenibacillus montanisoli]
MSYEAIGPIWRVVRDRFQKTVAELGIPSWNRKSDRPPRAKRWAGLSTIQDCMPVKSRLSVKDLAPK